ncbi:MAG: hypothetical protein PWQ51_50 [Methanolobus sp.]|jgi:hypothetical protein|nr:hypothetical protein [Methanolobus sp.]
MAQEVVNKQEIMDDILNLTVSEAKALGVPKTTLWDMQKRIREMGKLNPNTPAVRRLIEAFRFHHKSSIIDAV